MADIYKKQKESKSFTTNPNFAPIIVIAIHTILGAINLFIFSKTGSISLLGNGIHSLTTIIATVVMVLALRAQKEPSAYPVIQLVMGICGLGVMFLAIDRLWHQTLIIKEEILLAEIALLSVFLSTLLFLYLEFSGNQNQDLVILAQASDTALHIASAGMVFLVAIAGYFDFFLVDGILGIFVALLIMISTFKTIQEGDTKLLLLLLNEKPAPHKELIEAIPRLGMRFGSTAFLVEHSHPIFGSKMRRHVWRLEKALTYIVDEDLVQKEGEVYSLTETGKVEAQEASKKMAYAFKAVRTLTKPTNSPILSLITHICLGTVKLFGFFIIGSVSLLSDGLDSIMDGVSAIVVGISMKIKQEVKATYLLLFLMLITGAGTLWESIARLLHPIALVEEFLAIKIAGASIVICTGLYFYQRFLGYRNQSLAILAQSEDSKNHVLTASLVLVAVFAGFYKLYFIDGVVGCFIGILILRGAYELYSDLRAQSQGDEIDYEKYKLGIWKYYDRLQSKVLGLWILQRLGNESKTLIALEKAFNEDFRPFVMIHPEDDPYTIEFPHTKEQLQKSIHTLTELGFLIENKQVLCLTEAGKHKLEEERKKAR